MMRALRLHLPLRRSPPGGYDKEGHNDALAYGSDPRGKCSALVSAKILYSVGNLG